MPRFIGCSLALAGASNPDVPPARRFREGVSLARASGCEAVQLDGMGAGMRARELDRSARRDVAAILKRDGLGITGVDLWIPEEHFSDPTRVDRALEALGEACGLAGELGRLTDSSNVVVSVTLPPEPSRELIDAVVRPAMSAGVRVADFNWHAETTDGVIGEGFDPATEILAGRSPVFEASRCCTRLLDARLTDANKLGRCTVGRGELNVTAYRATLEALSAIRCVTVDVRMMNDHVRAAREAVEAWRTIPR